MGPPALGRTVGRSLDGIKLSIPRSEINRAVRAKIRGGIYLSSRLQGLLLLARAGIQGVEIGILGADVKDPIGPNGRG